MHNLKVENYIVFDIDFLRTSNQETASQIALRDCSEEEGEEL